MAARPLKPTDLVSAAAHGDCEKASMILSFYPTEVNIEHDGKTALQVAAFKGNVDFMILLIREKADLYCYDSDYCTALHYAVKGNQPEATLLLLKSDTQQQLIAEKNGVGMTPPQLAFKLKHKDCIKVFIDRDDKVQLKQEEPGILNRLGQGESSITSSQMEQDESKVDENAGTMQNQEHTCIDNEPPFEKCYFCDENPATVTFEPCGCLLSCFECSLSPQACGCGQPIEKRCFSENYHMKKYIKGVQRDRTLLTEIQKELYDYAICSVCTFRPTMCALESCGHMFCVPCIKEIKKTNRTSNAECPKCRRTSRYVVLRPEWPSFVWELSDSSPPYSSKKGE